jgi:hypothetical protein
VYRLSLGGSVKDTVGVSIALPQRSVNEARLKFCASGSQAGELKLDQALEQDFVTINLMVGKH